VARWDELDPPGLGVWCDKSVVLGALAALRGERVTPSGLLDVIALSDATVWFDSIVVDGALQVEWPAPLDDAVIERGLDPEEARALRGALVEAWNQQSVEPRCQEYWRQLLADPTLELRLSAADMVVDSAASPAEFMRQVDLTDVHDLVRETNSLTSEERLKLAALNTVRAFAGGLIAAQLGLFHLATAVRRGLLSLFLTPGQVTELIAIEPIPDARFPSSFGRIVSVAVERGCAYWDAVATVRHELEPVRRALHGSVQDPGRIRPAAAREALGLNQSEWQIGGGLTLGVLSSFVAKNIPKRQVAIVQGLKAAAVTMTQAADDLCRVARLDRPVIDPALRDLADVAHRLAA
jgi:hypothetical protein